MLITKLGLSLNSEDKIYLTSKMLDLRGEHLAIMERKGRHEASISYGEKKPASSPASMNASDLSGISRLGKALVCATIWAKDCLVAGKLLGSGGTWSNLESERRPLQAPKLEPPWKSENTGHWRDKPRHIEQVGVGHRNNAKTTPEHGTLERSVPPHRVGWNGPHNKNMQKQHQKSSRATSTKDIGNSNFDTGAPGMWTTVSELAAPAHMLARRQHREDQEMPESKWAKKIKKKN